MEYEKIDCGLPVEHGKGEQASKDISKFRDYCEKNNIDAKNLTKKNFEEFYKVAEMAKHS